MKTQDGNFRHAIALMIVAGSFSIMFLMMFKEIPEKNKDMLNFAFGLVIGATLSNVIRSYFPTKLEPSNTLSKTESIVTTNPEPDKNN